MSSTDHIETVECDSCDSTFERHEQYRNEPNECESCHEQRHIESIRRDLDPDRAESERTFSRPKALEYLKNQYEQMPIVDHDGSLIVKLDVQHGRGIGAEPDGWWVEKIETITECHHCGYPRARSSFKSNAGHHIVEVFTCPDCGHVKEHT